MPLISRRKFGAAIGRAGAVAGVATIGRFAIARDTPRIVIIGGGAGGATLAVALKRAVPNLSIILVEGSRIYTSCFFSNLYLGGLRSIDSLSHNYDRLTGLGIDVVFDRAEDIDARQKIVKTRDGRRIAYDALVLSPGIDVKYGGIAGYDADAAAIMPHAYTADSTQKILLRRQIDAMRDGGTIVMAMPNYPYRCPPAPYERACMIAHRLKQTKPKSKLVILDPKRSFPLQALFVEAMDRFYKGIIELNLSTELDDFSVIRVDTGAMQVETKGGTRWTGDVINIIPQQKAGTIAERAGCTHGDWCPVDANDFTSKMAPDIFVIGDATMAPPMPKSAFLANSQAKLVASEIAARFGGGSRIASGFGNACWSLVAPDDLIKTGARFAPVDGKMVETDTFASKADESPAMRRKNVIDSADWYAAVTADMFATA